MVKVTTAGVPYLSQEGIVYHIPSDGHPTPQVLRMCKTCHTVWKEAEFATCANCKGIGMFISKVYNYTPGNGCWG